MEYEKWSHLCTDSQWHDGQRASCESCKRPTLPTPVDLERWIDQCLMRYALGHQTLGQTRYEMMEGIVAYRDLPSASEQLKNHPLKVPKNAR